MKIVNIGEFMSLDDYLLAPFKSADKFVQKQYTRVGKKIPEKKLYKITTGLSFIGCFGTGSLATYFGLNPPIGGMVFGSLLGGPDINYNADGLFGKIKNKSEGNVIAVDPVQNFCANYNKAIRLPIFLTAVGFLGKSIYDIANYFVNGEPLNSYSVPNAITGIGLLSLASSMYLKDQDPKLLEKKPSKIKAMYESLIDKLTPERQPVLEPSPIRYRTIDAELVC